MKVNAVSDDARPCVVHHVQRCLRSPDGRPPAALCCMGEEAFARGEGFFHLLSQRSWGRSIERQRDREGVGERRGEGVVGTSLSAIRGGPSPGLSADPSHFASLRGRGGFFSPPLPAKPGEVDRAKQDREGAGDQRGEGVIGTSLSAIRGGPSPGLRPTPPTSLRCVGGEVRGEGRHAESGLTV